MAGWQFWIDRGGTFTDIVARRPDGGLATAKLLSEDPEHYEDAALAGIRRFLGVAEGAPVPAGLVEAVKMGTTVATNALLERRGERVLLVTNKGFADALRIGTQARPDLFARKIVLPEMLYERVAEVAGRVTAEGEELEPLDLVGAEAALRAALGDGIRAVAILLMHGYRHTEHEAALAELARRVGFEQVSASHQASPLMKLVPRGDTTVVDAYVSPILRRYVDRMRANLPGIRLMFMQSSGGLTDAGLFQGKDSILSGPAGGVVGAVRTAAMAGFTRIIGFDMGGTSTDVCHYDGSYERAFDTMVAGVRLRAPMMRIHTVAAGGGSVLAYDGARFRVGPDSAGANPGPAAYRRGGPLTVTDCNVLLGKLQPRHFPKVFGANADQPLDAGAVAARFAELADRVGKTAEEVAEGFLRIAVENMANAIKTISVQRGYDVTGYTLVSFGGAGGQHACLVADALGMTTVFLHPMAGVLSAFGMGLADIRALKERAVEAPLDAELNTTLMGFLDILEQEGRAEVLAQGVDPHAIHALPKVHLRYQGSDTAFVLDFADHAGLVAAFEAAHRQRYGFIMDGKPLVVEAVSVEVVGAGPAVEDQPLAVTREGPLAPVERVRVVSGGTVHDTPVYDRAALVPGDRIDGPALILEPTGTNMVEPGWRAEFTAKGHLLLTRVQPRPKAVAVGTEADPVMLEVFNNLFMSIADQMGAVLANTAHSVNIKERLDFSCALFDAEGGLIANAPHVPVHLGSMGDSVRAVIRTHGASMRPGDSFVLNAPYNGGTHLPDVTVITPVWQQGRVLFYVGSRGHHADIGGITPGSMPPHSTRVEEEGVLLDNIPLVQDGRFREAEMVALLSGGPHPARNIPQNLADLQAQLAANAKGAQELGRMVEQFGLQTVQAYMRHVQDNAEESVRRVLAGLADGRFRVEMDDGSVIAVAVTVDRAARTARVDFTGTSPQRPGNMNAPKAITRAAVLYVFRCLVDDPIPLNEGCLKPIELVIPEGSMLAPVYPAAVVAGNVETSQAVVDCLMGALGAMAGSQGTMNNFTFGNERHQYYETIAGGSGAGPGFDGASAVQTHMTNSRLTDPEVLEWRYPVLVEEFSVRRGSGGQGRWTGGDGVVRRIRFREAMTAAILSNRRAIAPFGLAGGGEAKPGRNAVIRANGRVEELPGTARADLLPGDAMLIETPGGGGYGSAG